MGLRLRPLESSFYDLFSEAAETFWVSAVIAGAIHPRLARGGAVRVSRPRSTHAEFGSWSEAARPQLTEG